MCSCNMSSRTWLQLPTMSMVLVVSRSLFRCVRSLIWWRTLWMCSRRTLRTWAPIPTAIMWFSVVSSTWRRNTARWCLRRLSNPASKYVYGPRFTCRSPLIAMAVAWSSAVWTRLLSIITISCWMPSLPIRCSWFATPSVTTSFKYVCADLLIL